VASQGVRTTVSASNFRQLQSAELLGPSCTAVRLYCQCAGQRYGAAGDRVGDSTIAASSRLFLASYDSGSVRANGIGRSERGI
jgi:hypothetical protein